MKIKSLVIALIVMMAFGVMGAQCGLSGHVVQYSFTTAIWNGDDPGFHVYLENSLVPSMVPDAPTMCGPVPSEVVHRKDMCRVIRGLEELGDNRNWVITFFEDGNPVGSPPVVQSLGNWPERWGKTITTEAGTTYEGCYLRLFAQWVCDYRTTNQFVQSDNVVGGLGYFLDKAWHWSWYELKSDILCAKGIAAALKGSISISEAFLADCSDSPYHG